MSMPHSFVEIYDFWHEPGPSYMWWVLLIVGIVGAVALVWIWHGLYKRTATIPFFIQALSEFETYALSEDASSKEVRRWYAQTTALLKRCFAHSACGKGVASVACSDTEFLAFIAQHCNHIPHQAALIDFFHRAQTQKFSPRASQEVVAEDVRMVRSFLSWLHDIR